MAKLRMAHASRLGQKMREERERVKVGDNNGQATHGTRKHAWRTQAGWANLKPLYPPHFLLPTISRVKGTSGYG